MQSLQFKISDTSLLKGSVISKKTAAKEEAGKGVEAEAVAPEAEGAKPAAEESKE